MRLLLACLLVAASAVRSADAADRLRIGAQAVYGIEREMLGSGPPSGVHLAMGELQFAAAVITTGNAPRLEVISAILVGESLRPNRRFLIGSTETLRLHLRPQRTYGWYVEAGAGVTSSALQVRQLNGWMQYFLHTGIGGRRTFANGNLLTVGFRLSHLSNNMTTPPNLGLNLPTLTVGYAFRLR